MASPVDRLLEGGRPGCNLGRRWRRFHGVAVCGRLWQSSCWLLLTFLMPRQAMLKGSIEAQSLAQGFAGPVATRW